MSIKLPSIALAAAALCVMAGAAAPASAQENCGLMYQHMMQAYQAQSPYYERMLNRYNANCLSGASTEPRWQGHYRHWQGDDGDWRGHDRDWRGRDRGWNEYDPRGR